MALWPELDLLKRKIRMYNLCGKTDVKAFNAFPHEIIPTNIYFLNVSTIDFRNVNAENEKSSIEDLVESDFLKHYSDLEAWEILEKKTGGGRRRNKRRKKIKESKNIKYLNNLK